MMTTAQQIYDARVDWSGILEELSLVIPDQVVLTDLTAQVPATMQPSVGGGAVNATASIGSRHHAGRSRRQPRRCRQLHDLVWDSCRSSPTCVS
jgi:hypothetical protein